MSITEAICCGIRLGVLDHRTTLDDLNGWLAMLGLSQIRDDDEASRRCEYAMQMIYHAA